MIKKDDSSPQLVETDAARPRPVKGLPTFRSRQVANTRSTELDDAGRGATARGRMKTPVQSPDVTWGSLVAITLDEAASAGRGLFPQAAQDPVTAQFDILRTRMLQAMAERGWTRIAVTSPTHGCGKSLVAANLALSMGRLPSVRAVLIDLELRNPELAHMFGIETGPLSELLLGEQPMEAHVRRIGENLALALNSDPVPGAAETLLSPVTAESLQAVEEALQPNIMIFDLPPALGSDDVLSILPLVDAVLLVADATRTTAEDVRACERLLEDRSNLLGVVLNRARDRNQGRYRYNKARG